MNVIIIVTKSGVRYATTQGDISNSAWPLEGALIKKYIQFKEIHGDIILIEESSIDHIIIKNNGEEKV
jgi:hypothetical protein